MKNHPGPVPGNTPKPAETLLPLCQECLACYVARMLEYGCDGLKWSRTYRDFRAPRATALERKLPDLGGRCDCEVMANVFHRNESLWEHHGAGGIDEEKVPACLTVRRGTIRPCGLWLMRSGVQWGGGVYRDASKAAASKTAASKAS